MVADLGLQVWLLASFSHQPLRDMLSVQRETDLLFRSLDPLETTGCPMNDDAPQNASESGARESLALMRTDLANERTLLAYGRTALMVTATGFSLIKFFPDLPLVIGWGFSIAGGVIGAIGLIRFTRLQKRLRQSI